MLCLAVGLRYVTMFCMVLFDDFLLEDLHYCCNQIALKSTFHEH